MAWSVAPSASLRVRRIGLAWTVALVASALREPSWTFREGSGFQPAGTAGDRRL